MVASTSDPKTPLRVAFERDALMAAAPGLAERWRAAEPFPHIVVDDLIDAAVLDAVVREFPSPEQIRWEEFDRSTELKLANADVSLMGPVTRQLLNELNAQVFVSFLEAVTGIEGLVPDPHLEGGGLHQIRAGGFLKVHADFNRHDRLLLDRRLNVLLYLNKDWPDSYGGALELWDREMTTCAHRIPPRFNRMVVFATTDFSYHGHPEPLTCPPDRARRSLALYYYTNGRPRHEVTAAHTTLFKRRPDDTFEERASVRETLRRWVPPAVSDWLRRR